MALAILELRDIENGAVNFSIDTGTSPYYQLKVGGSKQHRQGIDWVDDVYYTAPLRSSGLDGGLLGTRKDISITSDIFRKGDAYVQLFSYKNADGRSPAFSKIIKVSKAFQVMGNFPLELESSLLPHEGVKIMIMGQAFSPPRKIPCRHACSYAQTASLEDLLATLVKAAAPAVLNILSNSGNTQPNAANAKVGAEVDSTGSGLIAQLLKMVLGNIAPASGLGISRQQSQFTAVQGGNRFLLQPREIHVARPFIFGIDDVLLGTLLGPLIQALPQMLNAANQKRVQMKQADNKLISDILSNVNRRMLLEQILQAQRQTPGTGAIGNSADLNQLLQLLQQAASAPSGSQVISTAPLASASSLATESLYSGSLSGTTLLVFIHADSLAWNGTQKLLYTKQQGLKLAFRLVVSGTPKNALPKAILKILFKDADNQTTIYEKTFKQKGVAANSIMEFAFSAAELSVFPLNKTIAVFAEMRWLGSRSGKEYKALGSTEVVLVEDYFLADSQGVGQTVEHELADMNRFRAFWNKVWEAPSLGGNRNSSGGDNKKYSWELDVATKYSLLLTGEHDTNGLMASKLLAEEQDPDSLAAKTVGKMRAGMELSIAELNKLLPLWGSQQPLNTDKLRAFQCPVFAAKNAGEFVYNFKLQGRTGERGMIWVVPIFQLFEYDLQSVSKTNEAGQVVAVAREKAFFPLPVACRAIGLKSQT